MNRDEWTPTSSFSASQDRVKTCLRESCRATRTSHWGRGPDGPQTLCNVCYMQYSQKKLILYQDPTTQKLSVRDRDGWYPVRITGFPLLRPEKGLFGPGLRRRQRDLSKPIVVPLHEDVVDLDSGPPQISPREERHVNRYRSRRSRRISTSSDDMAAFGTVPKKKGKHTIRMNTFGRHSMGRGEDAGEGRENTNAMTGPQEERGMPPVEEEDNITPVVRRERNGSEGGGLADDDDDGSMREFKREEERVLRRSRDGGESQWGGRRMVKTGSMPSSLISVKAEYRGCLRRLRVQKGVEYRAFHKDLGNLFGVVEEFVIMYKDEEGDYVTVASDRDMAELFFLIDEHAMRLLRVKLARKGDQLFPITID